MMPHCSGYLKARHRRSNYSEVDEDSTTKGHTYIHTSLHLHVINTMKLNSCVSFRICTPVFTVAEVELKRAHASNLAANKFLMVDCASFIDQPGQRVRLSHTHCIQNSAGRREAADKDNRACYLSKLSYVCIPRYTVRLFTRKHKVTMRASLLVNKINHEGTRSPCSRSRSSGEGKAKFSFCVCIYTNAFPS